MSREPRPHDAAHRFHDGSLFYPSGHIVVAIPGAEAALRAQHDLVTGGYDVFTYEPRNQGDSDKDAAYEPLQWVTDKDLGDFHAAVTYLRNRPDADPDGIGLFGISKGGSTGFLAAANDRYIRCVATDGAYATYTTLVPYMQRWVKIYSDRKALQKALPTWFYGLLGLSGVRRVARNRGVTYPSVEKAVGRLRQPLLLIHGEADAYIKPEMAKALYERAKGPKELWVVPKAKHNQALHVAGDDYHRRVVEFFDKNLGGIQQEPELLPAGAD